MVVLDERRRIGVAVKYLDVAFGSHKYLVIVLTVDIHKHIAKLAEDGDAYAAVIHLGGAAAVRTDLSGEEKLVFLAVKSKLRQLVPDVLRQIDKERRNDGLVGAGADYVLCDTHTEYGVDAVYQDRFSCACLACKNIQRIIEFDSCLFDNGKILNVEFL